MSYECGECEVDPRVGHERSCSRWKLRCRSVKLEARCDLNEGHDGAHWNEDEDYFWVDSKSRAEGKF